MKPVDNFTTNTTRLLLDMNDAADRKTTAERKWQAPMKPKLAQFACDLGMFSDAAAQLDLVDLTRKANP